MSNAWRLAIAVCLGATLALGHYAWMRFQAATIIAPASGRVLMDGKPLANAYVKFSPVPRPGQSPLDINPGSHGFTDSRGNFSLVQVANDRPGVIVGEHKIILRTGRIGPGVPNAEGYVGERVPLSWRKGIRSVYVSWTGPKTPVLQITTIDKYSPRPTHSVEKH
jgi:hypothetical protein